MASSYEEEAAFANWAGRQRTQFNPRGSGGLNVVTKGLPGLDAVLHSTSLGQWSLESLEDQGSEQTAKRGLADDSKSAYTGLVGKDLGLE